MKQDKQLGVELGYRKPWSVRQLIARRWDELSALGPIVVEDVPCQRRGHELVYYLNEAHCELLKQYSRLNKDRSFYFDPARLRARIEADSIPEPNSGCWLWLKGTNSKGYPVLGITKQRELAHRVSYTVHHEDPGDALICHHCDNPPCVNPEHLFADTAKGNTADMIRKERGWWQHGARS